MSNDSNSAISIALWGAPGSGKTTYLGALAIATSFKADGEWLLIGRDRQLPGSASFLVDTSSGLNRRSFPVPNTDVGEYGFTLAGRPAGTRLGKLRNWVLGRPSDVSFDFTIFDPPGGALLDRIYDDVFGQRVAACDALLYLYDPVSSRDDNLRYLASGLSYVHQQVAQQGQLINNKLPHFVALCLSKFDEPAVFQQLWTDGLIALGKADQGVVPRVTNPRRAFELLAGPTIAGHDRFFLPNRIGYFALSSIGFYNSDQWQSDQRDHYNVVMTTRGPHIRGQVQPLNVMAPLLWLAEQVNRVRAVSGHRQPALPDKPPTRQPVAGAGAGSPPTDPPQLVNRDQLPPAAAHTQTTDRALWPAGAPQSFPQSLPGVEALASAAQPTHLAISAPTGRALPAAIPGDQRPQLALKSKLPGDGEDYRVLAHSPGALDAPRFERLFRSLGVGNLAQPGERGAGVLPWLTAAPFDHPDGSQWLALVRQDWTTPNDRVGRPIALLICLCLPRARLNEAQPGLSALFDQIPDLGAGQQLPASPLQPPRLTFGYSATRLGELAALIDTLGFDFVAATAAQLLAQPVALRGDELPIRQRLDGLEALLSLLPYGGRAAVAVSTWMESAAEHGMRLGFSDAATSKQLRVYWRQRPAEPPAGSPAHSYLLLLQTLRRRYQDNTLALLRALDTGIASLNINEPATYVGALRQLDLPYVVYDEVCHGRGSAVDVRRLFQRDADNRFPAEALGAAQQLELLRFLLAQVDDPPADHDILVEHWRSELRPDLAAAAAAALGGADSSRLAALLTLARNTSSLGWLLADLVSRAEELVSPVARSPRPYRPLGLTLHDQLPALRNDELRDLGTALAAAPLLLRLELVVAALEQPLSLPKSASWRDFVLPVLRQHAACALVLIAAGLDPAQPTQEMAEALAAVGGVAMVRHVFAVATNQGEASSTRLGPVIAGWLGANLATLPPTENTEWRGLVPKLRAAPATLDLLYLRLDVPGQLPGLPGQLRGAPEQLGRYLEDLLAGLHATPRAASALARLARELSSSFSDPDERLCENVRTCAARLLDDPRSLGEDTWRELAYLWLAAGFRPRIATWEMVALCAQALCWLGSKGLLAVEQVLREQGRPRDLHELELFLAQLELSVNESCPGVSSPAIIADLRFSASAGALGEALGEEYRGELTAQVIALLRQVNDNGRVLGSKYDPRQAAELWEQIDALAAWRARLPRL